MTDLNHKIKTELLNFGADIVGFGGEMTICGKCIEVCLYTLRYIPEQ